MPRKQILFSSGLVTSRDPSLLQDGELSRADNAEYRPDDPGIWPVPGRNAFNNTGIGSSIRGLVFLEFDPGVDKLVALAGSAYQVADGALSNGSWSSLATGISSSALTLDHAFLEDAYALYNGVDRNHIITRNSDGTLAVNKQGMIAASGIPAIFTAGSNFILGSGNTITYGIEERVKDAEGNIIRRREIPAANTVTITGTGGSVRPIISVTAATSTWVQDPDATHWAVYATETNGTWPVAAELGEVTIATATFEDTRTATNPGLPSGDTLETISVSTSGVTSVSLKWGVVPESSTGDVFEGSLVQNDINNTDDVVYTFPQEIHAMPAIYRIPMRTKQKDEVKWIRTLGRGLLIGMRDSLWRVDTLPVPEDSAFQLDRIRTEVDGAFGGVGPLAVAKFSFGQGILLAYVSTGGIIVTDGFQWDVLTADIDWANTVNVSGLEQSILVNNPTKYRLEFYYPPSKSYLNSKALYLNYHPSHVKRGAGFIRAKITGPIDVNANAAMRVALNGQYFIFTGNNDGKAYVEGQGSIDHSGGDINFNIRSGSIYPQGVGMETRFQRAWIHHSAGNDGETATVRQFSETEGEGPIEQVETIPVNRREATSAFHEGLAEAHRFGIEMTNPSPIRFNHMTIKYEDKGDPE